jgi:Sec-independent protein translocase protein TatA
MLSIPDMALLGAAALMFFGPEQLPKVARKVGLLVRDVQNTSQSFIREMERAGEETSYGPDISRAHLIEEASGTAPAAPYVPPVHDPYLGESYDVSQLHDDHVAAAYAEHTEPLEHAGPPAPGHAYTAPETTPVLHDIVAPRAVSAPGDHDLPP